VVSVVSAAWCLLLDGLAHSAKLNVLGNLLGRLIF
jgi:hypothetical protein